MRKCLVYGSAAANRDFFPKLSVWLLVLWATSAVAASVDSPQFLRSYTLGPGDLIQIQVHGEEDLTVKVRIDESGFLSYPFLGEIRVSGTTVDRLQSRIHNGLAADYLVNPDVRVYILEYRPIYVNGEVRKPGGYPYVPGLSVQKAVALAGGFTDLASTRNMYVVREGARNNDRIPVKLDTSIGPGDTLIVNEGLF